MHARARGKSFLDVGCMWKVHGRIAFVAEEAGASRVTGIDVFPASEEFRAEHERRGSQVRFVQGDLNEEATGAQAGAHEVVWCSGVLYHQPDPALTLRRLRALTTETLLLQTTTLPELPGVTQGSVFYPGLPERDRAVYKRIWGPESANGFDPPKPGDDAYAPWFFGLSPSALDALLRQSGFEPGERFGDAFGVHLVARPA